MTLIHKRIYNLKVIFVSLLKPLMSLNEYTKDLSNYIFSAWIFQLFDGPVCQVPRFRQCVDFVSGVSRDFVSAYNVFFVAFQFVLPTIGTVICYALLIREVTSMVKNEESK